MRISGTTERFGRIEKEKRKEKKENKRLICVLLRLLYKPISKLQYTL